MITIAWDVDDVLNDLTKEWLRAQENCSMSFEELSKNPPHKILNIEKEMYLESLDEFRLSGRYANLQPVPEVLAWFRDHGDHFNHIALTAVPLKAAHVSADWVMREFGRWIRNYHFIPSFRSNEKLPAYDQSKRAYLSRFKMVDIFIDDSESNLKGVEALHVYPILFPRPWNCNTLTISEALEALTKKGYQLKGSL